MSRREAIARYNLIIQKLRKHPANFNEISDYLALESDLQEYNFNISKRTFQRDLNDIRSLYNIDIQYDRSKKTYYIDADTEPQMNDRILEAFDTFNALNIADRLSNYIHFEQRKSKGTENLHGLLHAIKNHLQISFTYHSYWGETSISTRTVEPYALKEYNNRWYLIANDLKDNWVKSFALERMNDLNISRRKFKLPKDFNVAERYKYSFGIVSPNADKPEEIILSFTTSQGQYIKSLPLHESQAIIIDNEKELRIKLKLFITHDFIMELLSFGKDVKVLEPKSLVGQIKTSYKKALKQYE